MLFVELWSQLIHFRSAAFGSYRGIVLILWIWRSPSKHLPCPISERKQCALRCQPIPIFLNPRRLAILQGLRDRLPFYNHGFKPLLQSQYLQTESDNPARAMRCVWRFHRTLYFRWRFSAMQWRLLSTHSTSSVLGDDSLDITTIPSSLHNFELCALFP